MQKIGKNFLTKFVFVAFALLVGAQSDSAHAQGSSVEYQDISIGKDTYPVFGKRISKSGTARLVRFVGSTIEMTERRFTYLPAGKILLVSSHCNKDRGKQWCFAVTENGIPIYVRSDGTHFFKADGLSGTIAVALKNGLAQSKTGLPLPYSPTEYFPVEDFSATTMTLRVDSSSQKPGFEGDGDTVEVVDNGKEFVVVDIAEVLAPEAFQVIRPITGGNLVSQLFNAVGDLDVTDEERHILSEALLNGLLVDAKDCGQEIKIQTELDGEIQANFSKFLRSVSLKLGVSGSYSSVLQYPTELEFEAKRFIQTDVSVAEAPKTRFFETWINKKNKDNSCTEIVIAEIVAKDDSDYADGAGQSGSITNNDAGELGIKFSATSKFPQYSCSDEYFVLLDHFTTGDGTLSQKAAELVIVQMARFTDASRPNRCLDDTSG